MLDFEDFSHYRQDIVRDEKLKEERITEQKLVDTGYGKYRLEIQLQWDRSTNKDFFGQLSFWEASDRRDGSGDVKVYICPGKKRNVNNCSAVIPSKFNEDKLQVCPTCGQSWNPEVVIGEVYARTTPQKWADIIHYYFQSLGGDCDLYIIQSDISIRDAARTEQERQIRGDLLHAARQRRTAVYPLANILKDLSSGADLVSRIRAFLTA